MVLTDTVVDDCPSEGLKFAYLQSYWVRFKSQQMSKLSLRAHLFPSGTLSLEKTRTDVIAALASQSAQPRAVQSEREAHCSFPLSLQLGRSIGRHGNQPSNQRQALPCLSQRTTHPPTPAWLCKVPHPGPGGRGREAESRGQGVGTPSGVPCPKPPKLG